MGFKTLALGFKNAAGQALQAFVNDDTKQEVYALSSKSRALNVAASAAIKASAGRVCRVIVTTAGAAGAIHDCATVGGVSAATLIAVIPAAVGVYDFNVPCTAGITYIVGAAQVVTVTYI